MSNADSEIVSGTVKFWNGSKAYGFITVDGGGKDVFVHVNDLPDGVKELKENQIVRFQVKRGEKGLRAAGVVLA